MLSTKQNEGQVLFTYSDGTQAFYTFSLDGSTILVTKQCPTVRPVVFKYASMTIAMEELLSGNI